MSYRVVLSPRAETQLDALSDYISAQASAAIADRFVDAIVQRCMSLANFPGRGTPREDIRPWARTIPFRRRVTIAYSVRGTEVRILGIFYGGQDIEALLREEQS